MTATPDRHIRRQTVQPAPPADVYHGTLGLDVLLSGDLVRSSDILPGDPTEDCSVLSDDPPDGLDSLDIAPSSQEFGENRRGYGRFRLAHNVIRVQIHRDDGKPSTGRMTNASVTGLFVRCPSPLPFRSVVRVEWNLMNDMKMAFTGKVVRTTAQGMAIHLNTDDANWRFRSTFIDMCRTPMQRPPTVTVRRLTAAAAKRFQEDDDVVRRLGQRWKETQQDIASDERHQRFIQSCLKEKRLQFALERYRELQVWPVEGFDPTGYLKQIGTILAFYQLQSADPTGEASALRRYFPIIVITVLMLLVLMGVPYLMGNRVTPHP